MKLKHFVSLTTVLGVGVGIINSPLQVQAVEDSGTTNGTAGFKTSSDNTGIVKPGTDNLIDMKNTFVKGDGKQPMIGNVKLSYAPEFNFGADNVIEATSQLTEYNVLYDTFYETVSEDDGNGKIQDVKKEVAIPQFVQVADESGAQRRDWEVTVEQTDFFTTPAVGTEAKHQLVNTRIRLYGNEWTNNLKETELANVISGYTQAVKNNANKDYAFIPVKEAKNEGSLTILKASHPTQAEDPNSESTNGTKTSLVFLSDYKEEDYEFSKTPWKETENHTGVTLAVPNTDSPYAKAYTAELVWTLSSQP